MKSGWEDDKKRLTRQMKVPAKKKLEWLDQINEFTWKALSLRERALRQKLRRKQSLGS